MKKSKLLELLADIPDDGEVYIWNGFVQDWMDIGQVEEAHLCKMSNSYMREMCRLEKCHDVKDWSAQLTGKEIKEANAAWRQNYKWELNPYVTEQDVKEGRYKMKHAFILNAKTKGETTFDRFGNLSY